LRAHVLEAIGAAVEVDEKDLHARAPRASRSGRPTVERVPFPSFGSRFILIRRA
jgi:hypothetical protein